MSKSESCKYCGGTGTMKITDRYPRSSKHDGERVDGYTVVCTNIKCPIYDADKKYWLNEEQAIASWNSHPPVHMYTLEELRGLDRKPVFTVTAGAPDAWEFVKFTKQYYSGKEFITLCSLEDGAYDCDINTYGVTWVAYDRPPEEE